MTAMLNCEILSVKKNNSDLNHSNSTIRKFFTGCGDKVLKGKIRVSHLTVAGSNLDAPQKILLKAPCARGKQVIYLQRTKSGRS